MRSRLQRRGKCAAMPALNRVGEPATLPAASRAIPGASETFGQAPAAANHNPAQSGRGQMQAVNHAPILRNPAFASLSPRNAETRALMASTFRGRFAQSGFARERNGHQQLGIVLGFVGPLFWPYAYDDFIDYTFWPHAYDTFWPYAYDDLFEGIYGAYSPEYYASDAYAYAGAPASGATYAYATGTSRRGRTAALTRAASQICSSQAQGLTDFPIERITQQVEPRPEPTGAPRRSESCYRRGRENFAGGLSQRVAEHTDWPARRDEGAG